MMNMMAYYQLGNTGYHLFKFLATLWFVAL